MALLIAGLEQKFGPAVVSLSRMYGSRLGLFFLPFIPYNTPGRSTFACCSFAMYEIDNSSAGNHTFLREWEGEGRGCLAGWPKDGRKKILHGSSMRRGNAMRRKRSLRQLRPKPSRSRSSSVSVDMRCVCTCGNRVPWQQRQFQCA